MRTFFFFLLFLVSISYGQNKKIIPLNTRQFNNVQINKLLIRDIGDVLISKGIEKYQDALQITERPEKIWIIYNYPYQVGDILVLSESNKEWDLYYNKGGISKMEKEVSFGVAINKIDSTIVKPFGRSTFTGVSYKKLDEPFKIKKVAFHKECSECFKQEFIYNGKINNALKFIYRECISDFARPAFTQELQYDITESNIIGFKD